MGFSLFQMGDAPNPGATAAMNAFGDEAAGLGNVMGDMMGALFGGGGVNKSAEEVEEEEEVNQWQRPSGR